MINLTFQPSSLEEFKTDDSINQDNAAILEVTGFELPIIFLVNNINLFEITREEVVLIHNEETQSLEPTVRSISFPWLSMPILNFALNGLEAVRQVYQGKSIDFVLPEIGSRLRFQVRDKEVAVYSEINRKTAIVDSLELLQAFENFRNEVRDFLGTELPHLREFAYWTSWFKEE